MAGQTPLGRKAIFWLALDTLKSAIALGTTNAALYAGLIDRILAPRAVVLTKKSVALDSVFGHADLTFCGLDADFTFFGAFKAKPSDLKLS
jgi:hypothetical protein